MTIQESFDSASAALHLHLQRSEKSGRLCGHEYNQCLNERFGL
jgi:hypothetical protein